MSSERVSTVKATRAELLTLRRRVKLAKRGHDLLVEKRDALLMHFLKYVRDVGPLRERLNKALESAYRNFMVAQIILGPRKLEEISYTAPDRFNVNERYRNIIGVTIPLLELSAERVSEKGWWYNFPETTATVDDAIKTFEKVLETIVELAEIETAVKRLAEAVTMTKRRVNALENVIIPRFENNIRFIQFHLEEMAREDFFRLKRIKMIHEAAEEAASPPLGSQ
ncbi:MAG: V-type ATP synthase subunit D [Candidatus Bathyarchaeia archaeon]